MSDIAIIWDPALFRGDWGVTTGDLATDNPLRSAVAVSLFTDRIASADYVPTDGTTDRRGWWGDTYEPSPIGSDLWQLGRTEISDRGALIAWTESACLSALQWLLDDGVAAAVAATVTLPKPTVMNIAIRITEPASDPETFSFAFAWKGL